MACCRLHKLKSIANNLLKPLSQYDNIPASLTDTVLGTYDGLTYNAIVATGSTGSTVAVGGIVKASPPMSALTSSQQQITNGTASFAVASPYKSFGLLDFFFGCTVHTGEGAVSVASQCTITLAGFVRNTDQEVALASFTFTPPESPVAPVPMIHAVLPPSFQQSLFNVTITQSSALDAVLFDNLHYFLST